MTFSLDPNETFIQTNSDPTAIDAASFELSSLGINSGDFIRLGSLGDFSFFPDGRNDAGFALIGVFSASDVWLPADNVTNNLKRVQDAIDAGNDYFTENASFGSGQLATDIAEDFFIFPESEGGTTLQVPTGATYLFLGVADSFYNNTDPDGDWGVSIARLSEPEPTPEPSILLGLGTLALAGITLLRRKRTP